MTVLAADMGGTRIKLGLIHEDRILAREILAAHSQNGLASRLPVVATAFRILCDVAGITPKTCDAIAVAFPSIIDPATGRVLAQYGKYADAPQLDLATWAKDEFGLPFVIEHDTPAALVGEWKYGASSGIDNAVMLTLGTGLGTGVIINGQLLRGCHGQAGCQGGHMTVRYDGRLCSCGNLGCAEAEASIQNVKKEIRITLDALAGAV